MDSKKQKTTSQSFSAQTFTYQTFTQHPLDQNLLDALSFSLFQNFTSNELELILAKLNINLSSYPKGSLIYMEQETCNSLDIILSGRVIVQQIDVIGNVLSIVEFKKGQTIAGNILFNKVKKYPMTITAIEPTQLLHLSKSQVLELCKYSKFTENLLIDISERAFILTNTIKHITRKSLRQKLIDYLHYLYTQQNQNPVTLPITKTHLANALGVARPSLSRELTQMKKDGILSYERNTIFLTDLFIQDEIQSL